MDIFTLDLMSRSVRGSFSCGLLGHPAVVTASFHRASRSGCFSHTPLVRPSPAALLFPSSNVTEANKLEIKRLPGKEQKTWL